MLLATLLALAPSAAPQVPDGDPTLWHKPPPVHHFEPDLKALIDPRQPAAPARVGLATFAAAAFGDLGPALLPVVPPLPAAGIAEAEIAALSGSSGRTWQRAVAELHFDAPGDGSLWVRGASYKAQVAADAFTYVPFLGSRAPRNFPVRLELRAATLDGRALPLAAPTLVRQGALVTVDRGALLERYRFELEAVEQLFVLERLERRGELALELALTSELVPRAAGPALELEGECGGVRYGAVTVLDAAGRSIDLPSRLEDGCIVLRVPADFVERATLPLTVDPLITTFSLESSSITSYFPDVAYATSHDTFQVVWEEVYSVYDHDIYSLQLTSSGVPISGAYLDVTTTDCSAPTVASNHLAGSFLGAYDVAPSGIRGRIRPADGSPPGPEIVLVAGNNGFPSLGGDASTVGPTYFLMVYERYFSATDFDIHAVLLDAQGAPASGTILIDNSGATMDGRPTVSKTVGRPPFATQRWNVAWLRGTTDPESFETHFAQLRWDGAIMTPSQQLTPSGLPAHAVAGISPPLDDPTGATRDWLLAVFKDDDDSLLGFLMNEGQVLSQTNLTSAFGLPGAFVHHADVDAQGCSFGVGVLGWQSPAQNLHLATLRALGNTLQLSAPPVVVDLDPNHDAFSMAFAVAQTAGGGRRGLAAWSEDGDLYGALYDLEDDCVGISTCSSYVNTSGLPAYLHAVGSPSVADNRLWMECKHLPPAQPGVLITSVSAAAAPFSQGVLCLAPPVGRFPQVQNSGAGGVVALQVDLANPPPGVAFTSGSTWHFQYWTRDGGPTNFSNSVTITFQ